MQIQKLIDAYKQVRAGHIPYDPIYPLIARHVADLIHSVLPGVIVEHIGSTAVPGCPGKGTIDLMIPIDPAQLENINSVLQKLGFQPQSYDEAFPETRPMRQGSISFYGFPFNIHLHLIPAQSGEIDQLRAFRDALKNNPRLRDEYAKCKEKLIDAGITDPLEYCKAKGAFIQEFLARRQPPAHAPDQPK